MKTLFQEHADEHLEAELVNLEKRFNASVDRVVKAHRRKWFIWGVIVGYWGICITLTIYSWL